MVLPIFLILVASLIFSFIFYRLHLPWVIALIAAGIVIGPNGVGLYQADRTIEFVAEIGLVFLMFMAGIETKLSTFKEFGKGIAVLSLLASVIPFVAGFLTASFFGLGTIASIIIGLIFISSSIEVVVPSMETAGLLKTRLGKSIISSAIVNDVLALGLISVIFQTTNPQTSLPLPLFYVSLAIALVALRWGIPEIKDLFSKVGRQGDAFEKEIRVIVTILLGTVVLFEVLGLHPITAGFFAGLILSETIKTDELKEKLHALAYGIFIPVFFVVVGTQTRLVLGEGTVELLIFTLSLVVVSIGAKLVGGWIGGKIDRFNNKESLLVGLTLSPKMATTLAVAFTSFELGLLSQVTVTAIILLSIISTFVASVALSRISV